MATNKEPIFLNSVIQGIGEIDNAQGTTTENLLTVGLDGGAITSIVATSTDASAVTLVLSITNATLTNVVGEVVIPIGAGTDGTTAPIDVLASLGLTGSRQNDGSILLGPSGSLVINAKAAVTAATILSVTATGGSFTA